MNFALVCPHATYKLRMVPLIGEVGERKTLPPKPENVTTLEIGPELREILLTLARAFVPMAQMGGAQPSTNADVAGRIEAPKSNILGAIESWKADMERRGCAPSSVLRFGKLARRVCEYNDWNRIDHLTLAGAQAWLAAERKAGWGGTTHDGAVSALKVWGSFLKNTDALAHNPFERLESSGDVGGQGSRALNTDEVRSLIVAAWARTKKDARAKAPTWLVYGFLAYTGLRHAEAEAVTWGCVDLESGILTCDPAWTKNGRRDAVPIHPSLGDQLRAWRGSVPHAVKDRVFPVFPNRHAFSADRELARIDAEDARGRKATCHSLRKWLATTLDAMGTSPGVTSKVLRHSENLTQARYIDPNFEAETLAVQGLPEIFPELCSKGLAKRARIADDMGSEVPCTMSTTPTKPNDSAARSGGTSETLPRVSSQGRAAESFVSPPAFTEGRAPISVPNLPIQTQNGTSVLESESPLLGIIEAQAHAILVLVRGLRKESSNGTR